MLSLRCSIWSEFGSPLTNAYTQMNVVHILLHNTNHSSSYRLYTNDIILTNQRVCTILTLNIPGKGIQFTLVHP